jgi:hypothetical protein
MQLMTHKNIATVLVVAIAATVAQAEAQITAGKVATERHSATSAKRTDGDALIALSWSESASIVLEAADPVVSQPRSSPQPAIGH